MSLDCHYCEDRKCNCGGRRRVTSAPKFEGEVKIECSKCGATWLHWHKKISPRRLQGTAKEI